MLLEDRLPVAKWNLSCLAGAIAPLLSGEEELIEALNSYDAIYWKSYYTMMANKTGLDKPGPGDAAFFELLEKTLSNVKPDMTLFYQAARNAFGGPTKRTGYNGSFSGSFLWCARPRAERRFSYFYPNLPGAHQKKYLHP
jgi:uncharacterized protein YdiU (UPF0061 family)